MAKAKQLVVLRITFTRDYGFEEGSINGWNTEKVIDEWFKKWPLHSAHASRDGAKIGYSEKLISVERLEEAPHA